MGEIDVSFRALLRGGPGPILRLAFPGHHFEAASPMDPSVDRPRQRTADKLFRVREGEREHAIHIEVEREWRAELPKRLFEYASGAAVATQLSVSSVVVLLRPGGNPPAPSGEYRVPGVLRPTFVFCYDVVPVWSLDVREMERELGIEAAPFLIPMRGVDDAYLDHLVEAVLTDPEVRDRRSTLQLLAQVATAILGPERTRRMLNKEWIMHNPEFDALIRELAPEVMKSVVDAAVNAAVNTAVDAARDAARVDDARRSLDRVLSVRQFVPSTAQRARIDAERNVARLDAWLDAAVTAASIDDVFRVG